MDIRRHVEGLYARWSAFTSAKEAGRPSLRLRGKRYTVSKRISLVLVSLIIIGLYMVVDGTSAVPDTIQHAVAFPVYYPKNLPPGYVLDAKSFRTPEPGVVLFMVTYGEGKDIVFSEQQQPSGSDIDKFVSSFIPLNTPLQFPLGQAKVGAYGAAPNIRTAVSLPVQNGPWLIVTAPSDVSHDDLVKILQALAK